MGLLARRRFFLRMSLGLGICSLFMNLWSNLDMWYMLNAPSRFSHRGVAERAIGMIIDDPKVLKRG